MKSKRRIHYKRLYEEADFKYTVMYECFRALHGEMSYYSLCKDANNVSFERIEREAIKKITAYQKGKDYYCYTHRDKKEDREYLKSFCWDCYMV